MKKSSQKKPAIALVYDKLTTTYGGAEWVLLALHEAFPNAPLYTTLHLQKKTPWTKVFTVFTSFLQRSPYKNHRFLVWLFPLAFESLDFSEYDVIISITSGEAKGILTKPNQVHISYILTPPRYLYSHKETYLNSLPLLKLPFISYFVQKLFAYLQWWDQAAAARPDRVIAISKKIQSRINQTYNRTADLIYPPVTDIPPTVQPFTPPAPYLLSLSRLVAYKRIDLSIQAAIATHSNLIISGKGEEEKRLIDSAGTHAFIRKKEPLIQWLQNHLSNVSRECRILFVGHVTNQERLKLLAGAQALLMPGLEDFGITALEAASLGTPSILHKESGVSEVLAHKKHALHISRESIAVLQAAIEDLPHHTFAFTTLQTQAKTCSTRVFTSKFQKYMYDSIILSKSEKK